MLEYDYDSEAEWEEEDEPEDGEDCDSGDDNEEEEAYVCSPCVIGQMGFIFFVSSSPHPLCL